MSASKCKRGPEVLLGATSSSSDDDSPRSADTSATTATEPPSPSQAPTVYHDCEVSSPGSSSTLSSGGGASVDGLPGFTQQSSQQTSRRPRVKKKKADLNNVLTGDAVCSLGSPHSEQTARQLVSSRLAKHQLTPRTKQPRGQSFTLFVTSTFYNLMISFIMFTTVATGNQACFFLDWIGLSRV